MQNEGDTTFDAVKKFFQKPLKRAHFSGKKRASSRGRAFRTRIMAVAMTMGATFSPTLSAAFARQNAPDSGSDASSSVQTCVTASGEKLSYTIYDDWKSKHMQETVKKAIDAVIATKTGESVLVPFIKQNGVFKLQSGMEGNTIGAYEAGSNCIMLNGGRIVAGRSGINYMKVAVVHEAAHAKQYRAGAKLDPNHNASTLFRLNRAMEADARLHEVFVAGELASKGDSSVWKMAERNEPQMLQSYNRSVKGGKSNTETALETMMGYYKESSLQELYDRFYMRIVNCAASVNKENAATFAQDHLSNADIASKVCMLNGESYMTVGDSWNLSDTLCNSVSETTFARMVEISSQHAEALKNAGVAAQVDDSHKFFYVRKQDGTYRSPEKSISAGTYKVASLAKEKGGR